MKICKECPTVIVRSKTGLCRPCAAKLVWKHRDRERHSQACAEGRQKRLARDPEWRKQLRETMLANRAKQTLEHRRKSTEAMVETVLGWCPPEHREFNRKLRHGGFRRAERQKIIGDMLASAERDRLEAMTPLERQLERLRNGACLVERPVLRRADHAFSLTGSSAALL